MLSLAGKFFTSLIPPSIERAETSLRRRWSYISGDFKVTPFDENIMLFDFKEEKDAKYVLEKGPWNVDGCILVLKEYPLGVSLTEIDFSVVCFWVKAEGLPLCSYTREEYEKIAKRLSDKPPIQVHMNHLKRAFWLKVEVDLRKPLKAGFFIGRQRKPRYVQFKYKNLKSLCTVCGKIDHTHCEEAPKERALTRKFRTRTYGPWLRYDYSWFARFAPTSVIFELVFIDKTKSSETTTYEEDAELLVDFEIDVVYKSEHEWLGKTLQRSLLYKSEKHRFRLPLSRLTTETVSNETSVTEFLSSEIEEMASLLGLRSSEKAFVIKKFLDYLMKNKTKWSSCRRRWLPLKANFTMQIITPIVEIETMLQERRDEEHQAKINGKISEVIKTRVEGNANLLSVSQWMESIQEALTEIGVTLVESELVQRAMKASKEAIEMVLSSRKGPKPADIRSVKELETVNVLEHEMSSCTICRIEMFLGDQATRMPCSHLFHEQCLKTWLTTGNSCPLCRFELP